MPPLSKEHARARGFAYLEAAEHLMQMWTDDPIERLWGYRLSERLRTRALFWFRKASKKG